MARNEASWIPGAFTNVIKNRRSSLPEHCVTAAAAAAAATGFVSFSSEQQVIPSSHFSGVYKSRTPCFFTTLIKKDVIKKNVTDTHGGEETRLSMGTLCYLVHSHCSTQSVFIYLQGEGVPSEIPSLWWMQAAAGSCCLALSLGLFVFGFQLSYHDICVLCIPWHVRLDQTTACHTEQQIKAEWVSCRYISLALGSS